MNITPNIFRGKCWYAKLLIYDLLLLPIDIILNTYVYRGNNYYCQLNFPRKLYHTTPLTPSTRSTLSSEILHSSAIKLQKGLKIFIYKTKQIHIQHICIVLHCSHVSSCLCHPPRIQTPNLKLAKIEHIKSTIFIICSIQQTDAKC